MLTPILIDPSVSHFERHEARELAKLYRDIGLVGRAENQSSNLTDLLRSYPVLKQAFKRAYMRGNGKVPLDGPWPMTVYLTGDASLNNQKSGSIDSSCQGSLDDLLETCLEDWHHRLFEGDLEDREAFLSGTILPLAALASEIVIIDNYFHEDFQEPSNSGARWLLESLLLRGRMDDSSKIVVCSAVAGEELDADRSGLKARESQRYGQWCENLASRIDRESNVLVKVWLLREKEAKEKYHDRAICFQFSGDNIVLKLSTSVGIFRKFRLYKGEDWHRTKDSNVVQEAQNAIKQWGTMCEEGRGIEVVLSPSSQ